MQCERLLKLVKLWYTHVREETMAPARMVAFIEQHAETCDLCLQDPDLKEEIAKITELVLPESKIPKAIRQKNAKTAAQEEENKKEQQDSDSDSDSDVDSDIDDDIDGDVDGDVDGDIDVDSEGNEADEEDLDPKNVSEQTDTP